jgi:hypothetical protein
MESPKKKKEKEKEEKRKQMELMRDKAWAATLQRLSDIDRIADKGPTDERDIEIVKAIFALVQGELVYRYCNQMEGM